MSVEIFLRNSLITYSKFRLGPDNSDKSRKSFRDDLFLKCSQSPGAVRTGSPIQPQEPSRQPSPPPSAWRWSQLLELLRQHGQNIQNNAPDDTCCLPMSEWAHWRKGSCTDPKDLKHKEIWRTKAGRDSSSNTLAASTGSPNSQDGEACDSGRLELAVSSHS